MQPTMIDNVPVWGTPDTTAVDQIKRCAAHKDAYGAALMADHHVGYAMPIGGVVAYHGMVSPSGVGYDIACGNKAVLLDIPGDEARANIRRFMDQIAKHISFGVGRVNEDDVDHDLFDDPAWKIKPVMPLKEMARQQLGTVGSGNHYVDLFTDEADRVWCGVHFGSRGLGHKIATHYVLAGGGRDGMHVDPVVLHEQSYLGQEYIQAMELAGRYAYAGRDWVCLKVARLLGTKILQEVHNHHNFAWKEQHNDLDLWVVRKGATPAFPGQQGFIGGSMGDMSYIVEGVDSPAGASSFRSTVHGAGRVMSRTAAAGKKKWDKKSRGFVRVGEGQVSQEMMMQWVRDKGVELRGAGCDESPHCYKRIDEVLAAHGDTIKIVHTLKPIGVAMAGEETIDPYKD